MGEAVNRDLVAGPDGQLRCRWATAAPEYVAYHDDEWGRPVRDDRGLYEKLMPRGLPVRPLLDHDPSQARGLPRAPSRGSRSTAWPPSGRGDVKRLLADAGIVRNRAKIEATIANARAAIELRDSGESLGELLWSFAPGGDRPAPRTFDDVPSTTDESKALARELKRRGFRFVGPTTAYALMQACGLVNDHLERCAVRDTVEAERRPPG